VHHKSWQDRSMRLTFRGVLVITWCRLRRRGEAYFSRRRHHCRNTWFRFNVWIVKPLVKTSGSHAA
jgi:hypothetical protein